MKRSAAKTFPKSLVIALTGATGFVGQMTLKTLLDKGHKVRALVRNKSRVTDIVHPNLEWVEGGLGDADVELVNGADCVVHLAGLIKAQTKQDFYTVNATGAENLARAAQHAGVSRFILMSSIVARQPNLSHYAGSKSAGERQVNEVFTNTLAIIRAPAVFGANDVATRPFYALLDKGLLPVPGGKNWKQRTLSMVYVNDLVRAVTEFAIFGAYDDQTFYPATIERITWPEFAEAAQNVSGKRVRVLRLPVAVLYCVASITSVTSRLFNKGHLTLGKLKEFLYEDWSESAECVEGSTDFELALKQTLHDFRSMPLK